MTTPELPFLGYLTVFRSRLGLANLVLSVTSLGHQSDRMLRRRIRQLLEARIDVPLKEPNSDVVLQYLLDKKLVGETMRADARYRNITLTRLANGDWEADAGERRHLVTFPVFQTDLWLSSDAVRSTNGVPTPDNVDEVIEFAYQLHLIDRRKNSWTSLAHLVDALRRFHKNTPGP